MELFKYLNKTIGIMKKSLQKKLKGYSLTAGAMIAAGVSANAQVQYSGVINHSMVTFDTYNIDLDGDGVDDFAMQLNTSSSGSFSGDIDRLVSNNNWMGTGFASALSSGVAVNSAVADWDTNDTPWDLGYYSQAGSAIYGPFPGAGDKFIGVKFDISGETHYGWIRVNLAADAQSMTVVDWAYESTAGLQIFTGATEGTAPGCSNISTSNITDNSADILVTPNLDGNLFYVLLLETETAPTAAEVLAGTGSGGATVVSSGNTAGTNGTEATINLSGLTANTEYTAYLVLDDGVTKSLSTVYDADFSTNAAGIAGLNSNKVNLFPNPSTGVFNIETKNKQNLNITVNDLSGRVILRKTVNSSNNLIDLSSYGKGIYNIQINNGNSIITKRIVIK